MLRYLLHIYPDTILVAGKTLQLDYFSCAVLGINKAGIA